MNQKPNILSIDDSLDVYIVSNSDRGWKKALSLLKYIEKKYDVYDINFNDNQFPLGIDRYPAAVAYLKLLVNIRLFRSDLSNEFSDTFPTYAEKLIKKIEKKIKSNKKLASINLELFSFQIIHLISILEEEYSKQNNFRKITRTYYKYNKYISNCLQGNIVEICEKYWQLSFVDRSYPFNHTNGQVGFDLKISPSAFQSTFDTFFEEYLLDDEEKIFINNPRLKSCFINALNYADDDEPCLLIGETGTGKEEVAKIIHKLSRRRENIFWAVNCTGFTESLFNSEISGIIGGAATDVETRLGAFLKACRREVNGKIVGGYHFLSGEKEIQFRIDGKDIQNPTDEERKEFGGTLFLDEVNSMPIELQAKLLRIIQEKEVQVVGEDRKRKFNIKIICASSKEIDDDKEKTPFRKDLYYRISRGIVRLPALREMKESIVDLARYLAIKISKEIGYDKKVRINKRAAEKLKSYEWPGNIRELENVLYRALKKMFLESDNILKYNHIEDLINKEVPLSELESFFLDKTHADIEKMYMGYIFEKAEKNKAEAMRLCGFKSKSPIHRLIRKYKLSTKI